VKHQHIKTAVMFSDVAGSSTMYKKLGDKQAKSAIGAAVELMMTETRANSGVVIKTIGDEVMSRFERAADACDAAIAIQRHTLSGNLPLSIRIGMGYGSTIIENDDVFGEVVNDAAAVSRIAKGQEIIVTQTLADQISADERFIVLPFDKISLKGSADLTMIYRIKWEPAHIDSPATEFVSHQGAMPVAQREVVELRYLDEIIKIASDSCPFLLGRDSDCCNLLLQSEHASREHCQIVYSRGKYTLIDKSTNGTYVKAEGREEVYLRREQILLAGVGEISLGRPVAAAKEDVIYYQCKSS
jgi:adenylate cyclase